METKKLSHLQLLILSFLLFSLFFGAGNLIFPPFLGSQAGDNMPVAIVGFLVTAVILPVLGVVVIAKFDGLEKLASKVNPKFAIVFTIVILISIGPGLGIPRAASVPFEMAIAPYLPESYNDQLFLALYSIAFFAIALWLSLNPSKLPNRVGYVLTPALLILLIALFISYLVKGDFNSAPPVGDFQDSPFFVGFNDGYQTMDAIAALNFGLVIAGTLKTMGVNKNNKIVGYTVKSGLIAGTILSLIYIMLAYMGMATAGAYQNSENGAVILRNIVYNVFGDSGAIILAIIFTLACLTTCVGLITSISKYFSDLTHNRVSYKMMAVIITVLSTIICNFGLNIILSISMPVLNCIYPISIMLVLLGLFNRLYKNNKIIYPLTISLTFVISFIYTLYDLKVPFGAFENVLNYILGFKLGFGWVTFAILGIVLSILISFIINLINKKRPPKELEDANKEFD